jgi:hypothetical protein
MPGRVQRENRLKEAEAALVRLLEREGLMRIDGHALAIALYEKLGETDKARKHRLFLEGLSSTVFIPGHCTSFEKPIEVLFVEEEYLLLSSLGLKMKQQALSEHNGHRFDVITTIADGADPEREFFFNIDLPWNALQASLGKAFEQSKDSTVKK